MKIVKNIILSGVILAAGSATIAHAEKVPAVFTGNGLEVAYNSHGLWNDRSVGQGMDFNGIPISYPGNPWQQVSIAYNDSDQFLGNSTYYCWGLQVPVVGYVGGSGFGNIGSTTVWNAGNMRVMKEESWYQNGNIMKIDVVVTNEDHRDVENFIFMHAVDPDQDHPGYDEFRTYNDVMPSGNLVMSSGHHTRLTTSYGVCDQKRQDVGHTRWKTDPDGEFEDQNFAYKDDTMHIRHREKLIKAGETIRFTFVFFVSNGVLSALHDYETAIAKACKPTPRVNVAGSYSYETLEARESEALSIVISEKDFTYALEKEVMLNSIKNLDDAKELGIKIGTPIARDNKVDVIGRDQLAPPASLRY
ncbi:MAG: hypothetical protein L3J70_10285 [Gammaproteobacteria bacterium]|nr:hypothetical protein [Gammaproteobacteria bacterium]